MKTKLFTLLLAVATSVGTMFAWDYENVQIGDLYYNLDAASQTAEVATQKFVSKVNVKDNSIAEWASLPANYVVSATCPEDASTDGLKWMKVYADAAYINILFEFDPDQLGNKEWIPLDIFLNTDNSNTTGGYGAYFTDYNEDVLLETAFIANGESNDYNPGVFKYWGTPGQQTDWNDAWFEPGVTPGPDNNWGAYVAEGQLPIGKSQIIDGNKCEIQLVRELIPCDWAPWADQFGIGLNLMNEGWNPIGVLPCVSPTDANPNGFTNKLTVTIDQNGTIDTIPEISGSVVIPENVLYEGQTYSVTSIGSYAFENCRGLTSVTIPNSVTSIGLGAFYGCESLTSVVWNAKNCSDYENDNTPFYYYSSEYAGMVVFDLRSQITSFTFGNDVEVIPAYLCNGMSNLTSIVIPSSVTSIGEGAFWGCGINKIYFSGTMEEWLSKSWSPGHISSSYSLYINDVAVTNVVIPNSVTSIGYGAFSCCSGLTSVTIPNSVTSIGYGAFAGCNNLKNVIIGSSVKVLEEAAFYDCSAIETITCYSQRPPTVNQNALYGLDYGTIVYVPADYLETYKMHDAWGLYDVRPLGAKSTETTNLNVTPAENTAEVAWPTVSGAATYELVIKDKGGNVICTLIFNSNGQLTQIAFNAPSRDQATQQTQATGFSFTVTGLENGTSYDLTITSKDNNGGTLDTKTISFTTTGEPQGIEDVLSNQAQSTKILRNGQIFILRGEKVYTLQGQEVK